MLIYERHQVVYITQPGVIVRKNLKITKKPHSDKFHFHISYTDIFDCSFADVKYKLKFPPIQRKFIVHHVKKGRKIPLELLSTKQFPLSEDLF